MSSHKSVVSSRQTRASVSQLIKRCLLLSLLFGGIEAFAAKVVVIDQPASRSLARQQVEAAAAFYGLSVEVIAPQRGPKFAPQLSAVRDANTVAVVVDAGALPALDRVQVLSSLEGAHGRVPLMVMGVSKDTAPALLRQWSSGAIADCETSGLLDRAGVYQIAKDSDVTRQLGGVQLPIKQANVTVMTLTGGNGAQGLIDVRPESTEAAVFVRTLNSGNEVFFASEPPADDSPVSPDPYRQQAVFANLAPSLLFLHYAAGERGWHSPGSYANFTIDDLWLREPYGHVSYQGLLQQAELHNFHATLAFIPWNFDRSEPGVVSLFRAHPDRLSICVHGNNHVHQEFGPVDSHPLARQAQDLQQALARMQKFTALTGIPYDPVMVFPHSVGPQATFSLLKRYNYLATANSLKVPLDAKAAPGADFALRPATLRYADFPSLSRYSVEADVPEPQLAIDAFLGNPMLFYSHESFFASGIDAFNKTADTVNRLQPGTKWRGLGDIARHLYVERLRDDGDYEVRAYSASIELLNDHPGAVTYVVEKAEDFSDPFTVLVDGHSYPFERTGAQVDLKVTVPAGKSRVIAIRYQNDLDLARVAIGKDSIKIHAIRLLSDFRDNVVSNTLLGREFIKQYAENHGEFNRIFAVIAGLGVLVVLGVFGNGRRRRNRLNADTSVVSADRTA